MLSFSSQLLCYAECLKGLDAQPGFTCSVGTAAVLTCTKILARHAQLQQHPHQTLIGSGLISADILTVPVRRYALHPTRKGGRERDSTNASNIWLERQDTMRTREKRCVVLLYCSRPHEIESEEPNKHDSGVLPMLPAELERCFEQRPLIENTQTNASFACCIRHSSCHIYEHRQLSTPAVLT
jgi:hypothetical protein